MKQTYQQCNTHVHIPMNTIYIYGYIILASIKLISEGGKKPQRENQPSQKSEGKPNRAQKCSAGDQRGTSRITDRFSLQRRSTSQSLKSARHPHWVQDLEESLCRKFNLFRKSICSMGSSQREAAFWANINSFLHHSDIRGHGTPPLRAANRCS